MFNIRSFFNGIRIKPVTSTAINRKGEMEVLDSSGKLNYHNGTTASPQVTEAHSATLTNKTIDADLNTITNIENADIKAGAAIDATKIANGSVDNTEFQYLDGVTSSIQTQLDGKQASGNYITALTGDVTATGPGSASATIANGVVTDAKIASGVDAAKIGAGTVSNTEFGYLDGVTSSIQTQLDNKQPLDADLTALAGVSSTGILARTGAGTASARTLTGDTNEITIGNGDGVSGNPTIGIADNPTIPGTDSMIVPSGTTAQRGATTNAKFRYNTDLNKFEGVQNGAWSPIAGGSGGINYMSANSDAEAGTTGWSTYADAAGTAPVDGTGGSPNITWTTTTSSPLRGTASFLLTKDAANRQGQGASYLVVTDRADFASGAIGNLSFNYEIPSGTYADGDLSMWLVGVTSGAVIPFSTLPNRTVPGLYTATAQLRTDDDDYRVCIHVASTSASAYTVKFDNFSFGPQIISVGPVVLATEEFPLVIKGTTSDPTLGTASFAKAFKSRTGDRATIQYEYTRTGNGTAGSGVYLYMMPVGWKIDLDVHPVGSVLGEGRVSTQTDGYLSTSLGVRAMVNDESSFKILIEDSSGSPGKKDPRYFLQASSSWGFSDLTPRKLSLTIPAIKIQGWGGTSNLSSEDNASPIVASIYGATASATAGNPIIFPTVYRNDLGAYNATTGLFTAPVSDWYEVTAFSAASINGGNNVYASVNGNTTPGANRPKLTQIKTTGDFWSGSALVYALAGQTISVRSSANSGAGDAGDSLTIRRMQNRQQIAASESIQARYSTTTAQSISAATRTIVNFNTQTYDSHGSVTTGASWRFTAPASGTYSVSCLVSYQNQTVNSGNEAIIELWKNGSTYSILDYEGSPGTNNRVISICGDDQIKLLAGEYIDIRCFSTLATALFTTAGYNYVSVTRTGNY